MDPPELPAAAVQQREGAASAGAAVRPDGIHAGGRRARRRWSTCFSFSICGSVYGTEVGSEAYRKPDRAKAKQLLAESGYKGEPIVIVGTPQLPIINEVSQIMAQNLRDVGANVDLQMGDWATVFTRVNTPHLP